MESYNLVIEKPKEITFFEGYGYTYVLNNPLKYTDPSGYTKVARDYSGESMYLFMQNMTRRVMDMSYGLTSFGGGGFSGSGGGGYSYGDRISAMGGDPRGWSYNQSTGNYENARTGETINPVTNHQGYKDIIEPILYNNATLTVYEGGIAEMSDWSWYMPGVWNTYKVKSVGSNLGPKLYASSGGGDGWHPPMALKDVGSTASYASGAIGLTQIGMLEYRMSLPIMSKVGTFGKFSTTYSSVGKIGGRLGYAGALIGVGYNINALNAGEIGTGRFVYRTGSIGASIGVGAAIGGPWGAAAGAAVGGISTGAEYVYDNALVPLWNEIQQQIWNFENAIKNGWYPGR